MEILTPKDGIRRWSTWEVLESGGGALTSGTGPLQKRFQRGPLAFPPCGDIAGRCPLYTRKAALTGPCWCLGLGLPQPLEL